MLYLISLISAYTVGYLTSSCVKCAIMAPKFAMIGLGIQRNRVNVEDLIIKNFAQHSRKIGDDAALIGSWLYSQDAFFEGVHFKRAWLSAYEIGYKAMMVNLSDAVAMNATPKYALLTLALPKTFNRLEREALLKGLLEAAKLYKCEIIGGDTIANRKLDLSITIISHSQKPLLRSGFKVGDILAFTGHLGQSKKHLLRLLRGGEISLNSPFKRPKLRSEFIAKSRKLLHAGMDISDGLFEDAFKMTRIKHLSFKPFVRLSKAMVCSGEEYEMLIAFAPKHKKALLRRAKQTRTALTLFAKVVRGKKLRLCKANHF